MALDTIADVVDRMRATLDPLPPRDGVACFTRLYLAVTEAVGEAAGFAAPEFLTRLDIRFAELFFAALDHPPRAWAPLVEGRARAGVAPIQFALAGMNAHINRDLPVALVKTFEELGLELDRHGPEHSDYLAVNGLLVETEARVKQEFLTGELAVADEVLGQLDDVIAMWNSTSSRCRLDERGGAVDAPGLLGSRQGLHARARSDGRPCRPWAAPSGLLAGRWWLSWAEVALRRVVRD